MATALPTRSSLPGTVSADPMATNFRTLQLLASITKSITYGMRTVELSLDRAGDQLCKERSLETQT